MAEDSPKPITTDSAEANQKEHIKHEQENVERKVYRSVFESPHSSDSESESDSQSDRGKSFIKKLKFEFKNKDGRTEDDGTCKILNDSLQGGPMSVDGSICNEDAGNDDDLMSTEEKERFQDIEKELHLLNTAIEKKSCPSPAPRLYTGPYGQIKSPFKKFSSFCSFSKGVKRSPASIRRSATLSKKQKVNDDDHQNKDDDGSTSDSSDSNDSSCSSSGSGSSSSSSDEESPESSTKKSSPPVKYSLVNKDQNSSESSEESDDDTGQLAINEDDSGEHSPHNEGEEDVVEQQEGTLDDHLTKKSERFDLSAMNVKSIIHKIITNESVVEMVRQAVQEELSDKTVENFEPMMTRSKVKEVLESNGQVPHPWGLSPVKRKGPSPTFLDIDLPEDEEEEDEDFNPDKVMLESDDDSESIVSSSYQSDLGSPSTPGTPRSLLTTGSRLHKPGVITPSTRDSENSNSLLSPMGPPSITVVPRSCQLGRKFQDAMDRHDRSFQEIEEELIAKRTRSKLPLTDLSILDIEANFMAPDITPDMYDTSCNDDDWQHFLKGLVETDKSEVLEDSTDTVNEEEDPEYNFLDECEEEYDQEDFRDDRAVKVSKRELHELIDELYEDEPFAHETMDEQCKKSIKTQKNNIVVRIEKREQFHRQQNLVLQIGDREKLQIADQLRKHIQLLTTTFIMAQTGVEEHTVVADGAKLLLHELSKFAHDAENINKTTMLRVCNLQDAMDLVEAKIWTEDPRDQGPAEPADTERLKQLSFKYENQILPRLSYRQMNIFWTNPTFLFPHLLPHGGFFQFSNLKRDRARVRFIAAEDNLLAMGLDQFSRPFSDSLKYIQMFLLPTKTIKQIKIRIKNLKANASKDNAVKYWKQFQRLPAFPHHAPLFDDSMKKPVKDIVTEKSDVPAWCKYFMPSLNVNTTEVKMERKKKRDSVSFSHSVPDMSPASFTGSRPCTPMTDISDQQKSSESSVESPVAPKRPKRPYRRRSKPESKQQGFVPLPLTSSASTQSASNNSITIVMMDKLVTPNKPPVLTGIGTPTFVVISNNQLPVTPPPPIVVPAPVLLPVSTFPFTPVQVSNSPATIATVCRPAIGSPQIRLTSVAQSLQPSPVHGIISSPQPSTSDATKATDLIADSLRQSDIDLGELISTDKAVTSVSSPVSVPTICPSSAIIHNTNPSIVTSPASVSSVTLTSIGKIGALSGKIPPVKVAEKKDELECECADGLDTKEMADSDETLKLSTSQHGDNGSRSVPTVTTPPKPALDLVAAYAQYFISPGRSASSQQQLLETTPKKKKSCYVTLAPKPVTPSDSKPVNPTMLKKSRSSPRRKQLQEKVKNILPKGFVISTFDTSPAKKVASNLVDKAMQKGRHKRSHGYFTGSSTQKYCNILPSPLKPSSVKAAQDQNNIVTVNSKHSIVLAGQSRQGETLKVNMETNAAVTGGASGSTSIDTDEGVYDGVQEEEERGVEEDEKCIDTESDYTQSEDGNETQEEVEEIEEVDDSQEEADSQEDDDNHIANLMQASTTVSYDPTKEDIGKLRVAKKDRDRDVTLAMLAPDIIESDPKRDDRDVVFAQAYLHKVKKALKDDLESLEKFLGLMYNFSKADENPVKLYKDLQLLFEPYPDLMHEFAGFLLRDQAMECDCYESYLEFHQARTFLRKIEIYFRQNPYQCQKVMKTLSRWHKKPGRKQQDLREQVEPLLKGQKYLLEEFSRFFPEERPPECLMDDFEEVVLDKSDEEVDGVKNDSFEDIEMLEEEEILGTKRCTCQCHMTGDDTYKKRKKHCYKCCLTVIDGELVYKVNKSTIKKVQVTYGPPIGRPSQESVDIEPDKPTQETSPEGATEGATEPIVKEFAIAPVAPSIEIKQGSHLNTEERVLTDGPKKDQSTCLPPESETAPGPSESISSETAYKQSTSTAATSSSGVYMTSSACDVSNKTPKTASHNTAMANDILAVAFSSALLSEVSMDTSMSPHGVSNLVSTVRASGEVDNTGKQIKESQVTITKPVPVTVPPQLSVSGIPGITSVQKKEPLQVSFGSCFSSVNLAGQPTSSVTVGSDSKPKMPTPIKESSCLSDGESPVFSPFSPFGQEVQGLTGMASPLSLINSPTGPSSHTSTKVVPAGKVRRVTPIPVKGIDRLQEDSSFQTAVVNSPVLFDTTSKSPFELIKQGKPGHKSLAETTCSTAEKSDDSTKLNTESGSSFKVEVTKSESSKESQLSNTSKESIPVSDLEAAPSGLSRIDPQLFSENANKEFPKTLSRASSVLLSEESLFQCLNKQPSFSDTLHSISNLTNILHALDERTLPGNSPRKMSQSSRKPSEVSSDSGNSLPSSSAKFSSETSSYLHSASDFKRSNLKSIREEDTAEVKVSEQEKSVSTCSSGTSSDSSSDTVDSVDGDSAVSNIVSDTSRHYFPTTVQSVENLDRLQSGSLSVSTLSSSDTSCIPTPSSSAVSLVNMHCDVRENVTTDISACGSDNVDIDETKFTNDSVGDSGKTNVNESANKVNRACANELSHEAANERKRKHKSKHKGHRESKYQKTSEGSGVDTGVQSCAEDAEKSKDAKGICDTKDDRKKSKGKSSSEKKRIKQEKKKQESVGETLTGEQKHESHVESEQAADTKSVAPDQPETVATSSSPTDKEPVWTTGTNRMILEGCKKRGIKDKTFAKMAKKIGNVTAEQVKKQFGQLYEMIFNQSPF